MSMKLVQAIAVVAVGLSSGPALSAAQLRDIPPVQLAQSDQAQSGTATDTRPAEEAQAEDTFEDYKAATARKLDEWSRKLEEYGDQAQAVGSEAGTDVSAKLSEAWRDVQEGWGRLTAASADAWDDSKVFLEDSWRDLEAAWADASDEEVKPQN